MDMLSIDQIALALDRAIMQAAKARDTERLGEIQLIAGYLMRPADAIRDRDGEKRFRVIAAHAANAREEILRRQDEDR